MSVSRVFDIDAISADSSVEDTVKLILESGHSRIPVYNQSIDQIIGVIYAKDLLDKNKVTHVRLIDVVGDINPDYASYDSEGHVVNDPWPTPFNSSGFDLDAVGVIHDIAHDVTENELEAIAVYPNPVKDRLIVKAENLQSVEVYNLVGQMVANSTSSVVDFGNLNQGIYFVRVKADGKTVTQRVVKQ